MGGEKEFQLPELRSPEGSPPHGRGKESYARDTALKLGITPAWAGKSYRVYHCLASCWNHPRMGGEKSC